MIQAISACRILKLATTIVCMNIVVRSLVLVLCCAGWSTAARAQVVAPENTSVQGLREPPSDELWRLTGSPYTYHYSQDSAHRNVYMLGVEKQFPHRFILGGALFRNSFGQPSAFIYAAKRLNGFTDMERLFAQVAAGVLFGYRGLYSDKVPLNYSGFSPGAVLSVGWQFTPMWSVQLNLLGNSAAMLQVSADFR